MSRVFIFVLLASGLAVTALSLERRRVSHHPLSQSFSRAKRTIYDNLATSWKNKLSFSDVPSDQDGESRPLKDGTVSSTMLSMVASSQEQDHSTHRKHSVKNILWNNNTKLVFYLTVWYLGNIYCK